MVTPTRVLVGVALGLAGALALRLAVWLVRRAVAWVRLRIGRCPWCGRLLLRTRGARTSVEKMESYVVAVCPRGHYGVERDVAGNFVIHQDRGRILPYVVAGLEESPDVRRGAGRGLTAERPRRREHKQQGG